MTATKRGCGRLRGDHRDLPRARPAGGAHRRDGDPRRAADRVRHEHRVHDARDHHRAPWWIHLSTAIVFGLGFATVLTLVVTPAALMAIANLAGWRARRKADRAGRRAARLAAAQPAE